MNIKSKQIFSYSMGSPSQSLNPFTFTSSTITPERNKALGKLQIQSDEGIDKKNEAVVVELNKAGKETTLKDVVKAVTKKNQNDPAASPVSRLIDEFSDITKDIKKISNEINTKKHTEEEKLSLMGQLTSLQQSFDKLQKRAKDISDSILGPDDLSPEDAKQKIQGIDPRVVKAAKLLRSLSNVTPSQSTDSDGTVTVSYSAIDAQASQKLLMQGYTAQSISNDTFNDLLSESVSDLKEYYKDKQKFEYDRKDSTAIKISDQLDLDVGKTSLIEKVIDLKKISIRA